LTKDPILSKVIQFYFNFEDRNRECVICPKSEKGRIEAEKISEDAALKTDKLL
jgi:hypothetical protein